MAYQFTIKGAKLRWTARDFFDRIPSGNKRSTT